MAAAGADRILIVAANHAPGDGETTLGVTYNSLPLTPVRTDTYAGQQETSLWYLLDPPTGAAFTVSIDFSEVTNSVLSASVSLTGVHQTTPIAVRGGGFGASPTATVSLMTTVPDAWIIDAMHQTGGGGPSMVARPGRIERWNTRVVSSRCGGSTLATTTAGSYTVDWSFGPTRVWAMSAMALSPAPTSLQSSVAQLRPESVEPLEPFLTRPIRARRVMRIYRCLTGSVRAP